MILAHDGLGAYVPPNLSNIHDEGAANLFKCFFGPRPLQQDVTG